MEEMFAWIDLESVEEIDQEWEEDTGPPPYGHEPMHGPDSESDSESDSDSVSDSDAGGEAPGAEPEDQAEDAPDPRRTNLNWCICTHCHLMPTVKESSCCKEEDHFVPKIGNLACITQNHHFQFMCLDREVLDVTLLQMWGTRGDRLVRPTPSK